MHRQERRRPPLVEFVLFNCAFLLVPPIKARMAASASLETSCVSSKLYKICWSLKPLGRLDFIQEKRVPLQRNKLLPRGIQDGISLDVEIKRWV